MKEFLGSLFVFALVNLFASWSRPIPLTIVDSKSHVLVGTPSQRRYLVGCKPAGGQWAIWLTVVTDPALSIVMDKNCKILDSHLDTYASTHGNYAALTIEKPHNIFLGNMKGTVIENIERFYNDSDSRLMH